MRAQATVQEDGVLGLRHPDVDVQREGGLAAGELAHGAVDELVAAAGADDGLVPHRRRVGSGRGGAQALALEHVLEPRAQAGELLDGGSDRLVRVGRELDRGLVRLCRHVRLDVGRHLGQHGVDLLRQRPIAGPEHHHLLLDPHREGRGGTPAGPVRGHRRSVRRAQMTGSPP